jgi:hypothetical protein
MGQGMAAVMALILLPLIIALGSVVSITGGGAAIADVITAVMVVAMGGGAFYGLLHLIHTMEGPEQDKHAKRA